MTTVRPCWTAARVAMKLDFTCGVRDARTFASVEYTDMTENDLSSMRQTREVAGALWSNTQANAEAALGVLSAALFGTNGPQRMRKSHSKLQWAGAAIVATFTGTGSGSQWVKLEFSMGATTVLTGVTGYDLIEAGFSMERSGSINGAVITPIPFGRPVVQTGTGFIPGRITVQAQAKAINQATAKAWVQDKRGLVTNIGIGGTTRHETDQPKETCAPEYAPFNAHRCHSHPGTSLPLVASLPAWSSHPPAAMPGGLAPLPWWLPPDTRRWSSATPRPAVAACLW